MAPLEKEVKSRPHKERQDYRDDWGQFLRTAISLAGERDRLRRIHPAVREAPQKVFLSFWESNGMDEHVKKADALREQLEQVL